MKNVPEDISFVFNDSQNTSTCTSLNMFISSFENLPRFSISSISTSKSDLNCTFPVGPIHLVHGKVLEPSKSIIDKNGNYTKFYYTMNN